MNFIAHWLAAGSAHSVLFFLPSSPGHACSKGPAGGSADAPVLISDINLTLARALPRNLRTTGDPLQASDGQILSTSGFLDLHASGGGEFTAAWRVNCKKNRL
jgi:hypothetical protein